MYYAGAITVQSATIIEMGELGMASLGNIRKSYFAPNLEFYSRGTFMKITTKKDIAFGDSILGKLPNYHETMPLFT